MEGGGGGGVLEEEGMNFYSREQCLENNSSWPYTENYKG